MFFLFLLIFFLFSFLQLNKIFITFYWKMCIKISYANIFSYKKLFIPTLHHTSIYIHILFISLAFLVIFTKERKEKINQNFSNIKILIIYKQPTWRSLSIKKNKARGEMLYKYVSILWFLLEIIMMMLQCGKMFGNAKKMRKVYEMFLFVCMFTWRHFVGKQ